MAGVLTESADYLDSGLRGASMFMSLTNNRRCFIIAIIWLFLLSFIWSNSCFCLINSRVSSVIGISWTSPTIGINSFRTRSWIYWSKSGFRIQQKLMNSLHKNSLTRIFGSGRSWSLVWIALSVLKWETRIVWTSVNLFRLSSEIFFAIGVPFGNCNILNNWHTSVVRETISETNSKLSVT